MNPNIRAAYFRVLRDPSVNNGIYPSVRAWADRQIADLRAVIDLCDEGDDELRAEFMADLAELEAAVREGEQ